MALAANGEVRQPVGIARECIPPGCGARNGNITSWRAAARAKCAVAVAVARLLLASRIRLHRLSPHPAMLPGAASYKRGQSTEEVCC